MSGKTEGIDQVGEDQADIALGLDQTFALNTSCPVGMAGSVARVCTCELGLDSTGITSILFLEGE